MRWLATLACLRWVVKKIKFKNRTCNRLAVRQTATNLCAKGVMFNIRSAATFYSYFSSVSTCETAWLCIRCTSLLPCTVHDVPLANQRGFNALWLLPCQTKDEPFKHKFRKLVLFHPIWPERLSQTVSSTKTNDISLHTPPGLSSLKRSLPSITVSLFTQSVTEQMATHQELAVESLTEEGPFFCSSPLHH